MQTEREVEICSLLGVADLRRISSAAKNIGFEHAAANYTCRLGRLSRILIRKPRSGTNSFTFHSNSSIKGRMLQVARCKRKHVSVQMTKIHGTTTKVYISFCIRYAKKQMQIKVKYIHTVQVCRTVYPTRNVYPTVC